MQIKIYRKGVMWCGSLLKTKADYRTDAYSHCTRQYNHSSPCIKIRHFLVAGTTGSGKSVFINSLLISAMSHSAPRRIKTCDDDPNKMVEFTAYKDLPYMLANPITDLKQANDFVLYLTIEMIDVTHYLPKMVLKKNLEEDPNYEEKKKHLEYLPYIMLMIQ